LRSSASPGPRASYSDTGTDSGSIQGFTGAGEGEGVGVRSDRTMDRGRGHDDDDDTPWLDSVSPAARASIMARKIAAMSAIASTASNPDGMNVRP